MPWIYVVAGGLMDIGWAVGLKYAEGFTRWGPTLWTAAAFIISYFLYAKSIKSLPIGTAYSVYTGIGAAGTVAYGMIFLDEPADALRILCMVLLVSGLFGLKLVTPSDVVQADKRA